MSSKILISRLHLILFILVFMLLLTFSAFDFKPVHADGILYATPDGTGDCFSWATSCTLQTALTGAASGDEIWAAGGVYKPTAGTDRTATFQLINGVALYGGFAGTETERPQRNPAVNVTILSGDIDSNDSQTPIITDLTAVTGNTTNSYHVVTGAPDAILDGFSITAGNANIDAPYDPDSNGGGMYNYASSITLTNVSFSGNSANGDGGGMYNYSSRTTLTNTTFSGNSANGDGSGMYNYSSNSTLTNVTFSGNSANGDGGGMYNYSSNPKLTNVTFSGNSVNNQGGGMFNYSSNPTLTNVTFSNNSANSMGGGMFNQNSNPIIRNTIFWNNTLSDGVSQIDNSSSTPSVSYSVVQGGYAGGTHIITTDPKLGTLGNYGGFTQTIPLQAGSSAIDTGNDAVCPLTDQRGVSRPQGAHCDIGAFELVETTAVFTIFLPLILR